MISVIAPIYNGESYIKDSVGSVLQQQGTQFEAVFLDDCSKDSSYQILASIKSPHLRVLRNEKNLGLFKTLNKLISEAKGDWIRLWAQDDVMPEGSLSIFEKVSKQYPDACLIYSFFKEIDNNGNPLNTPSDYEDLRQRTPEVISPNLAALLFFVYGCLPGNISTCMVNRKSLDESGPFLDDGYTQAMDFELWVRISETRPTVFIRDPITVLRTHTGQASYVRGKFCPNLDEEYPIYQRLRERLKPFISEQEMNAYWRRNRGLHFFHTVMRPFLSGNFSVAWRSWKSMKKYGNRYRQFWVWLTTLNGRFGNSRKAETFDAWVKRLPKADQPC